MKLLFMGWKADVLYTNLVVDATTGSLITADLVKASLVVEPVSMLLLPPFEFWLGGLLLE